MRGELRAGEALSLATSEAPPQFVAYLPPRSLDPGVVVVEARAPAERGLQSAEPFTRVAGGTVIGNVYRVGARGPIRTAGEIRLRAPFVVQPEPVVAHKVDGRWRALPTRVISGAPSYAAALAAPGDYALVVAPAQAEGEGEGGPPWLLVVLVPLVLVVAGALAAGRLSRRRSG